MIIVMEPGATAPEQEAVVARLEREGFKVHLSRGVERTIIGVIGDKTRLRAEILAA
ncbi:MAG: 3-deoxy-7-phosphoheptulonate synthase, partial [Moorella sp. (in: Bacteria)]|nr:3-deoxy-7-phosphoheptulonate synthase [Moorella sp. (in: firmicutes)]